MWAIGNTSCPSPCSAFVWIRCPHVGMYICACSAPHLCDAPKFQGLCTSGAGLYMNTVLFMSEKCWLFVGQCLTLYHSSCMLVAPCWTHVERHQTNSWTGMLSDLYWYNSLLHFLAILSPRSSFFLNLRNNLVGYLSLRKNDWSKVTEWAFGTKQGFELEHSHY